MSKHKGKDRGSKKPPAEMPLRVRKHLDALGMQREQYLRWCADNGFAYGTDKTVAELEREAAFFADAAGRNARIDRILQNPRLLIHTACANGLDPNELSCLKWAEFLRIIANSRNSSQERERLEELLQSVQERAGFVFEQEEIGGQRYHYAQALVALAAKRSLWLRALDQWRPEGRSRRRQFASLLRHLLTEYPVPEFMDIAWFGGEHDTIANRARNWFIHIGRGGNIRTTNTPFPLTKRMAHCFLEAPDSYSPTHALRWGQVHALGGDRRLIEALLGTRLAEDFANHEFWQTVIQFFINNPMLDRRHVGPIVDYIQMQKFEVQQVMLAPGVIENVPPPHPEFTMRGRTVEALLRQIDAWHEETTRARPLQGLEFEAWSIRPSRRKVDGSKDNWLIYQLLTGTELVKEGKVLNHCVATYAESCARGRCSIWTMERETPLQREKTLTIEVVKPRQVVQVRGRGNRLPTRAELDVIRKWAVENGLAISNYVMVQD